VDDMGIGKGFKKGTFYTPVALAAWENMDNRVLSQLSPNKQIVRIRGLAYHWQGGLRMWKRTIDLFRLFIPVFPHGCMDVIAGDESSSIQP
jgi:hypothetical protein